MAKNVKESTTPALNFVAEKSAQARDGLLKGVQTVTEKSENAKETTLKTGQQGLESAKDTVTGGGKATTNYATQTRDYAFNAVDNVGKGAIDIKDKAVAAGYGAAEYTRDSVIGATNAVTGAAGNVAGFVGDKAIAAKDALANVGKQNPPSK